MRGLNAMSGLWSLFSYVDIEARIPTGHPIRIIGRTRCLRADAELAAMYSGMGRPSIAPERLLRGSLLQIIFSVRSKRQLMERWSRWTTISRSAGSWGSALTIPFGITRFRNATAC